LLFGIIAFAVIGGLFVDPQNARPLSTRPLQPPSWALPFGSDRQGRNLFAVITSGTLLTLRVGLIAGGLGVTIGAALAFVSAYYGGWVDTVLRSIVDVGLTVPNLMVLIVVALMLRQGMTVDVMALVIASLAWLYPARTIRSQVLTLRERAYVEIARLSGVSGPGIIVKEILPNLLPYLMASLVGSVSAAILASIGLDVLGLGVFEAPTLGMTLYWVNFTGAVINGWWWWWLAPIIVVGIIFIGLFLISVGLDEVANPRLRRQV
jgi:peptide/nickel transport system permease protein